MEHGRRPLSTYAPSPTSFSHYVEGEIVNYSKHTQLKVIHRYFYRYEQQEIALNCGTMLRECIRYEALTKILLHSDNFYDFFKYVEVSTFDIASDAFATFKVTIVQYMYVMSADRFYSF